MGRNGGISVDTYKKLAVFLSAQKEAEKQGKNEFTCPLCGGRAKGARYSINDHLHVGCEKCEFYIME